MPEMEIPEKLLPLIEKKKRFKVLIGGRGGAKSQTICDIAIMDAHTRGLKIAFFREFQNSIEDSSFSLLCDEIKRMKVQGFTIKASSIEADGQDAFKFRGLARNAESIKSMHGFDRFIVDEAQTISFQSLKILTPTLREEESEIWFSGNPGSSADPFSQRFIKPFEKELRRDGYYEDDMHLIIWINYDNNPFFPAVLNQERLYDKKHMTEALYNHVWEGEYYDSVDNCLIPTAWFDAAIDAHIKKGFKAEGAIVAAHDPSDEGPDSKGYCLRHGSVVLDIAEKLDGDINQGGDWATEKAIKARADLFVFDCDGMGIGLKRQIDSALNGKKMDYFMFKGSEAAENPNHAFIDTDNPDHRNRKTNKESLKNKRAQYYWRLRERFYATYRCVENGEFIDSDKMISLSSEIDCLDQLRSEVCRIPLKLNDNSRIQIMSKIDMARKPYELPSPNLADALMMTMVQFIYDAPVRKRVVKNKSALGWD